MGWPSVWTAEQNTFTEATWERLGVPGVANRGMAKKWGTWCVDPLAPSLGSHGSSIVSGDNFVLGGGGSETFPCLRPFRQVGGDWPGFPVSAPSQSLPAQNNPDAKVTYFGVARSALLHLLCCCWLPESTPDPLQLLPSPGGAP